ncbi:MAG: FAD-dependent oxidoreductase, partial [Acetobacteraceae bacterium]
TRATDFIAPRQKAEARFRNAALALARQTGFGKRFVNSGRLSTPTAYRNSPLSTPDDAAWAGGPPPGAPIPDAPLGNGYLSERLGHGFALLHRPNGSELPAISGLPLIEVAESDEMLIQRFDLMPGSVYLIRPDRHIAARLRAHEHGALIFALQRAGAA